MPAVNDKTKKFRQLRDGLNTGLMIFVDDDFTVSLENAEKIASDLVCLSEKDVQLLVNKLRGINYEELANEILKLYRKFYEVPIVEEDITLIKPAKRLFLYLSKVEFFNEDEIKGIADSIFTIIKASGSKYIEIESIFM
ncbi:hypothetical protein, partial [Bacillus cereus]|uniref:hypothetical protein n=1 Tax=Bacillus cereus TaxID=1396 RepID=UPI001155A96D